MMALLLGALCACEEVGTSDFEPVNETQALSAEAEILPAQTQGDAPNTPVRLEWLSFTLNDSNGASGLTLRVTNVSENAVRVKPTLNLMGLGTKSAALELGASALEPKQFEDFSVAAEDLPIQLRQGAATMYAQVTVETDTPNGVHSRRVLAQSRYLQHSDDYKKVKVFDEKGLKDQLAGKLHAQPEPADRGKGLGRVKNKQGAFETIGDEPEKVLSDDGTEVFIMETGVNFSGAKGL